eukprot:1488157-Prymnesium_polylepis.1
MRPRAHELVAPCLAAALVASCTAATHLTVHSNPAACAVACILQQALVLIGASAHGITCAAESITPPRP